MTFKLKNLIYVLLALLFMAATAVKAAEVDERMTQLRREEIQAKQARADELTEKITVMQRQLEEERKAAAKSQEKIWQDYTQGIEIERKKITDQLSVLDERQKAFEAEMDKKRRQDETLLRSKQEDVQRVTLETQRLQAELEEDRRAFDAHIQELKNRPQPAASSGAGAAGVSGSSEVLGNRAVKVAMGSASEILGDAEFRARSVRPEYYVEIGDTLDIDVWRVPDLSRSVPVRPDGRISMPVVGDLDVVGLSLVEVRDLLTQKFSEYVWSPQVSISIRQFGGRKFIILGAVGGPGVYRYQNEISLLEAIALAGGFSENSRSGKVMVIRGDIKKQPQVKIISANMENVIKKGMLTENIAVMPNDIIYVGKDMIGDANDIIKNVVNPFFDTALNYFVLHSASRADHNS